MHFSKIVALVLVTSMLSACQQPGQRPGSGVMSGGSVNKQDVGTLGGAIAGGIIGSNIGSGKGAIAGTIAGTLLGGALGNSIGASLDNADRMAADQAAQRALENSQPGQSMPWKNSNSGNYGTITPSNYYQNNSGQYCREYTQTITVGGQKQQGHGTACRQPDGSWQIVE